ncbi:4-hydroxyphenylacetate 3-monooxygenase, reductase component [Xenorhabdus szentirmaii]|uniref:4-hydroxyphenylacetate 3-monooxygenase reductase component n=1 Tax=Xenorhabdus szentirmaii DSM 16338 TaxID=1427518 RepID=W1J2D9_9GAMM|nr:4-hydroxyphenylacetate 3-monooxygenase, reductase component [Xenorhabdus szentirmaii]PHM30453.1 4-hydroxyphenylacetate 3-monooxygenase, reductase component [Xenorhabdus szentirmaii DSM 16338]CDL83625.1 4-hydroxyphenylacetate 3-monooxygenase reductase component [Xenorhabdus szentirmaii DSM 16338]
MDEENEHRLRFRDAMANLSAAVNIITTNGIAGRYGITATAVCSVTDTPPTLLVCINRNSAMNSVLQNNGQLCVNILNHQQESLACHFAGKTDNNMEERFNWGIWETGKFGQPKLQYALANLEGNIVQIQEVSTHYVYLVEIKKMTIQSTGHGLIYFKRVFHPLIQLMGKELSIEANC